MSDKKLDRQFAKTSAAATVAASLASVPGSSPANAKILGSDDTVRVGFVGVGNRGSQLMQAGNQIAVGVGSQTGKVR